MSMTPITAMQALSFPFFEDSRQWILLCVLGVLVGYALLRSSQRIKGKGRLSDRASRNIAVKNLSNQSELRGDLERLIVELQELSRQINAHIDTRFCKLDVLIRQADQRIKRLEQLNGSAKTDENPVNDGNGTEQIDPQREIIYKLADAGRSPVEIAQQLDKHRGEIELILSLRRSNRARRIDYRIDD